MAMTLSEMRAYQRGYKRSASWPETRPPQPPETLTGAMVKALIELRDAVDGQLGTFMPDDEMVVYLKPYLDRADDALKSLGVWLKDDAPQ